mmetsp:Transcript_17366/g.32927  ORF Transcript_17366/g.32927 Transcript_17366/m.32927 type:complete len:95 (+) Transcript_17366:227-511(+)
MPPKGTIPVHVSPPKRGRNSQRKIIVKAPIKKEDSGIIDFGFITDRKSDGIRFSARKLQQDIKYIQEEVVWDMLIEPMFVENRPKSKRLGLRRS